MVAAEQPSFSVVVGWIVPYRRVPLTRANASWPLGRVDAYDDRLALKIRGLPERLSRRLVIPVSAISRVERIPLGLRVHLSDHEARYVNVVGFGASHQLLVKWLDERGITVT